MVSLTGNSVYQLISSAVVPLTLASFSGVVNNAGVALSWQTSLEENIRQYEIEYSMDGASFMQLNTIAAQNGMTAENYSFSHSINYTGTIFYRLKIAGLDGMYSYSGIVKIVLNNGIKNFIAPHVINDGIIHINLLTMAYHSLELISMNGTRILNKNITGQTGNIKVPSDNFAKGIYTVRLIGNTATAVQKIVVQ